jgi:hypothetical protein
MTAASNLEEEVRLQYAKYMLQINALPVELWVLERRAVTGRTFIKRDRDVAAA